MYTFKSFYFRPCSFFVFCYAMDNDESESKKDQPSTTFADKFLKITESLAVKWMRVTLSPEKDDGGENKLLLEGMPYNMLIIHRVQIIMGVLTRYGGLLFVPFELCFSLYVLLFVAIFIASWVMFCKWKRKLPPNQRLYLLCLCAFLTFFFVSHAVIFFVMILLKYTEQTIKQFIKTPIFWVGLIMNWLEFCLVMITIYYLIWTSIQLKNRKLITKRKIKSLNI